MTAHRLAIVGAGPLCTYAVERLAALLPPPDPSFALHLSIFDRTGEFGAGATHSGTQAETSYMNRVASQIAFAADESNSDAPRLLSRAMRPTFIEWALAKYESSRDERFLMRPGDVPRRYLHGQALREMFEQYVMLLRSQSGVTVDLHASEVVDIERDGDGFLLHTAKTGIIPADRILLVTGHSNNHPAPGSLAAALARHAPPARYVASAYPLAQQVTEASVPPGCAVAVLGMGLTAIDVLLHLTEGRGGRFDGTRYVAGGREPAVIVAVSPSGMFPSCRPENEKAVDPTGAGHSALEHKGVFLTTAAIDALRRAVGRPRRVSGEERRQLDFERHVFPLIVLEMAYVYYTTLLGRPFGPELRAAADSRYRDFLREGGDSCDAAIEWLLQPVQARFDAAASDDLRAKRFDWRTLFEPLGPPTLENAAHWQEKLIDYMRRDHADAAEGNLRNPVKAACDAVWRDLRSVLSAAADFGGLTAESHRRFIEIHLRYYTRMSNGIGLAAMSKVLALIEAGVVDVSVGPSPFVEPVPGQPRFTVGSGITGRRREVDVVIEGRAHPFDAERDVGPLYPNLFNRGLVRRARNPGADRDGDFEPGGLDVTRDFHPIQRDGSTEQRITILGAPVEGVAFFQLSAARPRSNSAVLNNVARWANEFVESIAIYAGAHQR